MPAKPPPSPSRLPLWAVLLLILAALFGIVAVAAVLLFAARSSGTPSAPVWADTANRDGIVEGVSVTITSVVGLPHPATTAAPSRTPYQPVTNTPTPSATPTFTPTPTPTHTATPTPTATDTPTPTATPQPPTPTTDPIPSEAYIFGIKGYAQTLPLSCEARSAVDWARFHNVEIAEMTFQYGLPSSLNPNTGFVGSPNAERGQIPPGDYGVHAAPVASLLRAYGMNAWPRFGMGFDDLRREVAAGRPVIAWVIGNVWYGYGVSYTAPDGETMTVAAYEHTVIVTGYTPTTVRVVDGGMVYNASLEQFLASWGVLGNMAITSE